MLRIEHDGQRISLLESVRIARRYDLRRLVIDNREVFLKEIRQEIFVTASEVQLSEALQVHCDLLGIDRRGNVVIVVAGSIEPAGPFQGPQIVKSEISHSAESQRLLMRGMMCAAMAAKLTRQDLLSQLKEEQAEALGVFLDVDAQQINNRQELLLVAETFEPGFLSAVHWLKQSHGVAIMCVSVRLYHDSQTETEYLYCQEDWGAPYPRGVPL